MFPNPHPQYSTALCGEVNARLRSRASTITGHNYNTAIASARTLRRRERFERKRLALAVARKIGMPLIYGFAGRVLRDLLALTFSSGLAA